MDIIKQDLLILSVLLLWTAGYTDADGVTQTGMLWEKKGNSATMNCSHTKGATYFQMYWYRQLPGETMELIVFTTTGNKNHDFGKFSKEKFSATKPDAESGTFTVNDLVPDDKGLYFCAVYERAYTDPAYFGQGTKLTVLDPDQKLNPPQVKVLRPSAKECRNKKKTLVCVASEFYPDHVSVYWKINGENHTDGVVTDNNALKKDDGSYTITSRLRVAAEDWYSPDNNFTCIVSFYDGKETTDYPNAIYGVEAPAAGREITRERYLRLTNAAKLSYGVFIAKSCIYGAFVAFLVWKLQGSTGKQSN